MDKVDTIILSSLRSLGCPIDEDVKSVADLSSRAILLSISLCINTINTEYSFPTETVPTQMAAAVSLSTKICEAIKSLGYRGSIGYHQFLYASPVENRKVLSWIITQLPNPESEEALPTSSSSLSSSLSLSHVSEICGEERKKMWRLSVSSKYSLDASSKALHEVQFHSISLEWPTCGNAPRAAYKTIEDYLRLYSRPLTLQPALPSHFAACVIDSNGVMSTLSHDRESEWGAKGIESGMNPFDYWKKKEERIRQTMSSYFGGQNLFGTFQIRHQLHQGPLSYLQRSEERVKRGAGQRGEASRFRHQMDFSKITDKKRNPEEIEKEKEEARKKELEGADAAVTRTQMRLDNAIKQVADMQTTLHQLEPALQVSITKTESLKQTLQNLRKTNELLPEAEENIKKLQLIGNKNAAKLMELALQWEEVRAPLVAKLREQKSNLLEKRQKSASQMAEIRQMRKEMKSTQEEIEALSDQMERMAEVFEKFKSDFTRDFFTTTIDEIVRQVKKQQIEIDKILKDTRMLKKDRNTTSSTLSRSFAITSDLLFQDAKRGDLDAKSAFRLLVGLHRNYEKLSQIVEETGSTSNGIMTLQQKAQALEKRTDTMDLATLSNDLGAIREENKKLMEKK